MKLNDVMTTSQVATLLQLSPDYVRLLCRTNKLRAKKIGNDWLITAKDVKYLKRNKVGRPKEK